VKEISLDVTIGVDDRAAGKAVAGLSALASRASSAPIKSITLTTRIRACSEGTYLSAARFCLGEYQAPARRTSACWLLLSNARAMPRFFHSRRTKDSGLPILD
jgi:hypothetical protein